MDETDPDLRAVKRNDSARPAGVEARAGCTASYPSTAVAEVLGPEARGARVVGRAVAVAQHMHETTARPSTHEAIDRITVPPLSVFITR